MNNLKFPVFFVPGKQFWHTAKFNHDDVDVLQETEIPLGGKFSIDLNGDFCWIKHTKSDFGGLSTFMIYGKVKLNGEVITTYCTIFKNENSKIIPKSILVLDQKIIIGGAAGSEQLIGTIDLEKKKLVYHKSVIHNSKRKSIDDLLFDRQNRFVYAIDNIYEPKYIIKYSVSNDWMQKIASFKLPSIFTQGSIAKGVLGKNFLCLFVKDSNRNSESTMIQVFRRDRFDQCQELKETKIRNVYTIRNGVRKLYWKDVYITNDDKYLIIAAGSKGIGIIEINRLTTETSSDLVNLIRYYSIENGDVFKIVEVPNDQKILFLYRELRNEIHSEEPKFKTKNLADIVQESNTEEEKLFYRHPANPLGYFNLRDKIPFHSLKSKTVQEAMKNHLDIIEWGIINSEIFCLDRQSIEYLKQSGKKLSTEALHCQKVKDQEIRSITASYNQRSWDKVQTSDIDDNLKIYKLDYKLGFGSFADLTIKELIQQCPQRFEFYVINLPWFTLNQKGIDFVKQNHLQFPFLNFTFELLVRRLNHYISKKKNQLTQDDVENEWNDKAPFEYGSPRFDVNENPWIDLFGEGSEAEDAYWNTD